MANERTFLAWIRTAVSLLAGGVLLEQFAAKLDPHIILGVVAFLPAVLAAVLYARDCLRWRANEIAMRHAHKQPGAIVIPWVAASILGVAAAIAVLLALQ